MFFDTTELCLDSNYLKYEKTETICLALAGLTAGWLAARPIKCRWILNFLNYL